MRLYITTMVILLFNVGLKAQVLPGTLDVTGFPNFSQSFADVITEAGEDDKNKGYETEINASELGFILDPSTAPITGFVTTSEQNCTTNIYRYKVFIHMEIDNKFEETTIEVKTFANSGVRFPSSIPYDSSLIQPLGPRNLTPENGGGYISIPSDPKQAIKIMEFVGCRESIPVQFRVNPSTLSPAETDNVLLVYTVVGSVN